MYITKGKHNKITLTEAGRIFVEDGMQNRKSLKEMSAVLEITPATLSKIVKTINPDYNSRIKYTFNHNFFSVIDTHEKAYWLGFWAADGNIYKNRPSIQIRLKSEDIGHLYKFCDAIGLSHDKVAIYNHGKNRAYQGAHLHIDSKQMKEDLIKLGVTPNKSLTFEGIKELDEQFLDSFLLGYLDGDGTISTWISEYNTLRIKLVILGTKQFLESIIPYLTPNTNQQLRLSHNCRETYELIIYKMDAIAFLTRAYSNLLPIPLERKYNIFQKFCSDSE